MDISRLREHLKSFQFDKLFIEGLGWNYPEGQNTLTVKINGFSIPYNRIAEINRVPILKFNKKTPEQFKKESEREKLHKKIKDVFHNHLLLFSDNKNSVTLSYFSKEEQVRTHDWFKGQSEDDFIGKLTNVHFSIEDAPKITEIGKKLEKAFDSEKVIKRFFTDFKTNHLRFQKYISGIKNDEEKKWYASIILNRLMFIWFLQKKGFTDNDRNYLETKLEWSEARKKDSYWTEFLTLLFFEGFAKKPIERSPKAKACLGKIKYLNGGLFVPHSIEDKYKNKIKIRDKAFKETFKIFNQYEWHLQNTKAETKGEDKDISPDIMGYIFEKYINELQQKSLGAYYTRDEITKYLSRSAIQKCILDKVKQQTNQKEYAFESLADLLHKLDIPLCKLLLTDEDSILNNLTILDPAVGSGAFLVSAMKELMNIYSPIIGKIETSGDRDLKKWMGNFKNEHRSVEYGIKKSIILKNLYGVDIMKEATEVCKLRLFLSLVSSALNAEELEPLPNMDFNIMCGNSLMGFLNEKKQIKESDEQLMPIRFENAGSYKREHPKNLKSDQYEWDVVLGESYERINRKYNKLVRQYKNKALSFEKLKELKQKISSFLNENNFKLNRLLADNCNKAGLKYSEIIDIKEKTKITDKRAVRPEDFFSKEDSKNLKPFHWDFAFNEIIGKGGFDIILTNPPWEKVKTEDREFFYKYDNTIDKKKTKKEMVKSKKLNLLKNPHIKKDYLKTEEFYFFQRAYFSKLYQYQSGAIISADGTEKQASADMDTYRLFTERCFTLLRQNGFLGIVIPSGFHKDDGAIGLRRELLFKKAKIEGLIDFQNQMAKGQGKIFEGVDSRFKFLLLNLKKDKPQDKFPCQFHERDLKVLDESSFPKNPKMTQSIEEIKKLSPRDCSIIEFKDPRDKGILTKASRFPTIGEKIINSWNPVFYREFDETNDSHLFKLQKLSDDYLPLYKGQAIYQYKFNHNLSSVNRYVSRRSNKIQEGGFPFRNECYRNYRLVIRTIAGNTNERSLISAVIPKNHFIANSLYGVYIEAEKISSPNPIETNSPTLKGRNMQSKKNGHNRFIQNNSTLKGRDTQQIKLSMNEQQNKKSISERSLLEGNNKPYKYMFLLQAFLNSFVVDYFIRQKVSANINKKYIIPLHVPRLTEKDPYFTDLVERSAKLTCIGKEFDELADEIGIPRGGVKDQRKRWKIQGEIDAMVAYVYDLTEEEFKYILSTFTTGKNQERLNALKKYALSAFQKNKFISKAG